MKKTTQYTTCPDCGANLDPNETCECTKKSATSVDALEAEVEKHINESIPENTEAVKSGFDEGAFIKKLKDIDPGCYCLKREEMESF